MPNNTSVSLSDELTAAISASGRSIPDLIRAGLEAGPGPREDERHSDEVWLAGVVAELVNKLNDGYVLVPRNL